MLRSDPQRERKIASGLAFFGSYGQGREDYHCRGITQAFLHFRTTNWTIHPTDYFFIRALVLFVVKFLLKSLAHASVWDGTEWRMETEKWKNGENRG